MVTQEFYIRNATDTEARGPFSFEQLASLAENGQVTRDTLYYDATTEQWVGVSDNPELTTSLFPEKKNLRVRPKENVRSLNAAAEDDRPITVQDMLAAADGRTEDTRDRVDPAIAAGRAAMIGQYAALVILLISAAAFALPSIDVLTSLDFAGMLANPLTFVAILDLVLALLIGLQVVACYPVVRFRAMLVLGFIGFITYMEGDMRLLAGAAASSIGLYICTVTTSIVGAIIGAVAGIGGSVFLALQLFG